MRLARPLALLAALALGLSGCGIFTTPSPTIQIPVPDALTTLLALSQLEAQLTQPLTLKCQANALDPFTCDKLAQGKIVLDQDLQALATSVANPGTTVDWSKVSAAFQMLVQLAGTAASFGIVPAR